MQNNRTSVGSLVVLGTLAVMGWGGFLILFLHREQKPIQIPAPIVHVDAPQALTTPSVAQTEPEDYDLFYTPATNPSNGGSGQQPKAVVSVGAGGRFIYNLDKGAIENALRQDIEESEKQHSIRVIMDNPPSPTEVAAGLKSHKSSVYLTWVIAKVWAKDTEWRIKLPFTTVADPKARQLVQDERERRIKQIVAAAESGGNV